MSVVSLVEEHPVLIFGAVAAVALLAWAQSNGGQGSSDSSVDSGDQFTGGGMIAAPYDPNQAATDQARIAANAQTIGVLASAIVAEKQSQDAKTAHEYDAYVQASASHNSLVAALANTAAGLQESIANTRAALTASLFQTSAQRDTQLAATQAAVDIAHEQGDVAVAEAGINSSTQIQIAQINANTAAAIYAANAAAADRAAKAEQDSIDSENATARRIARAQDNTSILNTAIQVGGMIVGWVLGGHSAPRANPSGGGFSGGNPGMGYVGPNGFSRFGH
jgi:hypothetical protein